MDKNINFTSLIEQENGKFNTLVQILHLAHYNISDKKVAFRVQYYPEDHFKHTDLHLFSLKMNFIPYIYINIYGILTYQLLILILIFRAV